MDMVPEPQKLKFVHPTPTSLSDAQDAPLWQRRSLWVVCGLLLVRWWYAAAGPIDLVPDEAYYWDWSRQLDWGYYSKPPMIAWLIGLSTWLGGSTPLAVRMPAVLLGTVGLLWVNALGTRLYGPRVGFWALLLTAATPGNAALGLLMTIDAPFLFSWGAALYCLWRFLEDGPHRYRWWAALTVATGCGLLSKETMLGFLPLAGLFLLTGASDRRELLRPACWLWVIASLLFLTPVVWWNQQHGWITAQHSSTHFTPQDVGFWKRLALCGEFLAGQLGAVSPVTCGLFAVISVVALRCFFRLERRERFLLCFSGLPMLGVVGLSLLRRVQPNWPAGFYPAGIVLVAGWALGRIEQAGIPRIRPRVLTHAVVVGFLMVAGTYVLGYGVGVRGTAFDLVVRLRGWRTLGQAVGSMLEQMPHPARTLVIVKDNRDTASELAFYLPSQPRVYLWNSAGEISSQYDVWGGPSDAQGWDAMIVTPRDEEPPPGLAAAFAQVEGGRAVTVPIGARRSHSYRLWRGVELRAWPGR